MTKNLAHWLATLYLPNIGPRTFLLWLEQFTDIQTLFQATDDEMHSKGIHEKHRKSLREVNWKLIENDLKWCTETEENYIITLEDEAYPKLLKEISDPPLVLFVKGNKLALSQMQIAIVGARNATHTGLKNAEQFARVLAEAGWAVTSGLALGTDGAAHKGALKANGITVGICGTGLKQIYPASHKKLVENMLEQGGAIVSEFPLATPAKAENFPRRNRVISGMSAGVLVVEAALKSGSLITARCAIEQGREVFAIPGSIHNLLSRGCHHLIRQGAKLVESAEDIFEELGGLKTLFPVIQKLKGQMEMPILCTKEKHLLDQIEYEITPMDVILLRSGLTANEVSSILLILELNGYIQSVPGGYIREVLNL